MIAGTAVPFPMPAWEAERGQGEIQSPAPIHARRARAGMNAGGGPYGSAAPLRCLMKLVITLLILLPVCAGAADYEAAIRAAEEGDFETARRVFASLAASGDPRGENGLGVLYVRGQGLEQDLERAVELFRSAAEKGLRSAQKNLGEMYAEGIGMDRDDAAALHWFNLAAAQDDPGAQLGLGMMYGEGRGVVRDYAKAMEWFRKSAEQGNAEAQANIGHLYRAGYGVERDYVLAYAWYGVAAANDFRMGPELRESVAEYLTPSQLERARAIARGIWKSLGARDLRRRPEP